MNASAQSQKWAEALFAWLGETSWQVIVLIALVLLVQWVFRNRLNAQWRSALWLVVVVRLLLPTLPESSLSIFNLKQLSLNLFAKKPPAPVAAVSVHYSNDQLGNLRDVQSEGQTKQFDYDTDGRLKEVKVISSAGEVIQQTQYRYNKPVPVLTWRTKAVMAWLAGLLLCGIYFIVSVFVLSRKIRLARPVNRPDVLLILAECRQLMDVRQQVVLLESSSVCSPAVCGVFAPKILLPPGLLERFERNELRHVILHELAHIKRGDLWQSWLLVCLQIIHWFNPAIWFAFARLRADRELACDELALIHSGETQGQHYGQTILKLLEDISQTKATPGLVGIVEDRKQMAQRLRRIAAFRLPSKWSWVAVLLVVGLCLVGLTGAQQPLPSSSEPVSKRKVPVEPKPSAKVAANLQFSTNLTGKVLLPDGRPAAGSTVTTRGFGAANLFDFQKAETDNQGSFSMPEEKGVLFLMATHPLGFAQVKVEDFRTQPLIRLESWGRVEGALGMEPSSRKSGYLRLSPLLLAVANAPVLVRDATFFSSISETGVYSFEKIPPGEYRVLWSQSPQGHSTSRPHIDTIFSNGALMGFVRVEAGKTAVIKPLPQGLTVKAKLTLPEHAAGSDWSKLRASGRLTSKLIQEISKVSPMDFDDPYWKSDAYRNSLLNFRDYELKNSSDGVIIFEDVTPGEYFLSVSVLPTEKPVRTAPDDFIVVRPLGRAQLKKTVVIPEPAAGKPAVFDLGNLELVPSGR